jgi:hypothetical protein
MIENSGSTEKKFIDRKGSVNCDQIVWLLDIFDRYLPRDSHPRVSREREMKKYAMLYEVMEIAELKFEDDSARSNGTPHEARKYDD